MGVESWFMLTASLGIILLTGYLKKKADNLATREDVEEITEKVESLKAAVGAQQFIHQTRYENEYKILMELSEKIIALNDASVGLRPAFDRIDPNETEEERKNKRLEIYNAAAREFYMLFQTRQAFYPEEIFQTLRDFLQNARKEAIQYSYGDKKSINGQKYWEEAQKNSNEISELKIKVIKQIRDRVSYWEEFEYIKSGKKDGGSSKKG